MSFDPAMALSEDSFNARRSKTWVRLSQSWTVRKQLNISRRNSQVAPVRDSPPLKPLIRLSDAAVTVTRRRATLTITRHRARWTTAFEIQYLEGRGWTRLAHRGAARLAFLVGLVMGI